MGDDGAAAMRILIVEDERRMAEAVRRGLSDEGHAVSVVHTGTEGHALARDGAFDAIVLDVMLPGMDGLTVARRLRADRCRTPILMLTARDTSADIVAGLNAGADDYLVKPFSFEVLLARLRAVTRRGPVERAVILSAGDVTLDPAAHEVRRSGVRIDLTRTEFALLECLIRRQGTVVPRIVLIESVWGPDRDIEDNTLDAFVRLLRQKVDAGGGRRLIHTVRGVGYCLRKEGEP
jgi:DNA-binding response OmpR family regulator